MYAIRIAALLLIETDHFNEAIAVLEKALAIKSNDPMSKTFKARALAMLGRAQEALDEISFHLAGDEATASGYREVSYIHRILGHFEIAIDMAQKAAQTDPSDPENWAMLLGALIDGGYIRDAQNLLDMAIEVFGDYSPLMVQARRGQLVIKAA
jgi:tetratricopeptide (TPR) repeat protein